MGPGPVDGTARRATAAPAVTRREHERGPRVHIAGAPTVYAEEYPVLHLVSVA